MIEKQYGIIGKPLSHSLSPTLHNFWFRKNNLKANYSLLEIEKTQIKDIINRVRSKKLSGVNVTVPYKQDVIPYLDVIVNDAKETSSINTIYLNNEDKIVGENTDVYGFEKSFINKLSKEDVSEKNILVLGSGGVAPSLIYAFKKIKAKKVFISNRTLQKAENIKKKFPFIEIIAWEKSFQKFEEMDIIINATSLGMNSGSNFETPIQKFKSNLIYYDVIYNPLETKMIKNFKESKIKTFNGLDMFLFQAQQSFFLWNKITPTIDQDTKKIIILGLKK